MLFKKAFAFPIISGYYIIKLSICLLYSEKKYGIQNKYENANLSAVIKHDQDAKEIDHIKSALGKEAQNLPTELLNDIIAKMV